MSRRSLIWHLGLSQPVRPVVGASLAAHRDALAQCGRVVVASPEEAAHATHELLGSQAEAGLRRAEVDGTWARVCDRVWAHKGVSLLSTPDLGAADKDQLRLALDPLIGVEVHLVVTLDSFSQQIYGGWLAELRAGGSTGWDKYAGRVLALGVDGTKEHRQAEDFWAGHELASLLARWGWTFHADRLHVVAEPDPVRQWAHLLDLAGCGAEVAAGLPAVLPPYADPAGVAVLRKVNRQLEDGLAPGSVALLTGDRASDRAADRERAAMPVASTEVLEGLVERWETTCAVAGHDVRGDLALLVDRAEETTLPGARDQLGVAVDALVEALTENTRLRGTVADLQADRDRLDRKRRKLKRRLEKLRTGPAGGRG